MRYYNQICLSKPSLSCKVDESEQGRASCEQTSLENLMESESWWWRSSHGKVNLDCPLSTWRRDYQVRRICIQRRGWERKATLRKRELCEEKTNLALTTQQTWETLKQSKDFSVELQDTLGALHPYVNVCTWSRETSNGNQCHTHIRCQHTHVSHKLRKIWSLLDHTNHGKNGLEERW